MCLIFRVKGTHENFLTSKIFQITVILLVVQDALVVLVAVYVTQ